MKATLLFFVLLFVSVSGFAQVKKQRLIAIGEYREQNGGAPGVLVLTDSMTLSYSGGRGSMPNPISMNYFDPIGTPGVGTLPVTLIEGINKLVAPNNLDSDEYALRTAFDTLRHYLVGGSVATLTATEGATYFPDGKYATAWHKSEFKSSGVDEIKRSFIYYYDRLIREHVEFIGGRFAATGDRFIIYDAFGNAVLDSTFITGKRPQLLYSPYRRVYDNNGRYTRLYQDYGTDRSYLYHPDGKVLAGSRPLTDFSYTPGIYGPTGWKYVDMGRLINKLPDAYIHLNAAGLKDTIIYSYIDSVHLPYPPILQTVITIIYNNYGNPVTRTTSTVSGPYVTTQSISKFYYEEYDAALSIESTAKNPISLSPNPTTGAITLHALPNERVKVTITNTLGQVALAESFFPQAGSTNLRLAGDAAPGLYYISVSDEGGASLFKGNFLKQ